MNVVNYVALCAIITCCHLPVDSKTSY